MANATSSARKAAQTRKNNQNKRLAKQRAQRQMGAVILAAAGILVLAMVFIPGEAVWNWFHDLWLGLFGFSAYLIGPFLLYLAITGAMDKPVTRRAWEGSVLLLLLSGAFQIFSGGLPDTETVWETVTELYTQGCQLTGGGFASLLFGVSFLKLFGALPAKICIVLLIVVCIMLMTGTTLLTLCHNAAKPVKKIEETYVQSVSKLEEYQQQRRFNIDVPVGEGTEAPPAKKSGRARKEAETAAPAAAAASAAKDKLLGLSGIDSGNPQQILHVAPEEPDSQIPYIDDILSKFAPETEEQEDGVIVSVPIEPPAQEPEQTPPPADPDEAAADSVFDGVTFNASSDAVTPVSTDPEQTEPADEPQVPVQREYIKPELDLLNPPAAGNRQDLTEELKANAQLLVDTLNSFGVSTRIIDISRGPSVTRYELQPAAGVKINRITNLADDIALNLAASGVRIEAPIPNKAAVGIEVPNKNVSAVSFREIVDSPAFLDAKSRLTVALGRDIAGNVRVADIAKMPHLLIAGATGSGKSVCINAIIMSLLYKSTPDEVKFLMIDPKVVELGGYNGIPHLLVPVVTDPKKAAGALAWAVGEMLRRYRTFADCGVRDIFSYNDYAREHGDLAVMSQVVIIIDELADLMMAAPNEVEDSICRLAQMARAAGMHLVIATQRPSVDVITGVIKANIPSRVAFAVSSQVDSRTILDMGGAEKLLGRGDMLFYPVGSAKPVRIQGCFVTDQEIERVIAFIKDGGHKQSYDDNIMEEIERQAQSAGGKKNGAVTSDGGGFSDEDDMLPQAIECVVEAGMASTSLLQRRLKLGYARAARIVDQLEEKGIVGPFEGSKPRQVLISKERWMEMKLNGQNPAEPTQSNG